MSIDRRDARALLNFTKGARDDFHEPDEQGISLVGVIGTSLDNAMGNDIDAARIVNGFQEAVVVLARDGRGGRTLQLNLATIIALARKGAERVLEEYLATGK